MDRVLWQKPARRKDTNSSNRNNYNASLISYVKRYQQQQPQQPQLKPDMKREKILTAANATTTKTA